MMESCELLSGLPGPTGPVGSKGALGQLGIRGDKGNKGFPGEPGNPGIRGGGYPVKGQKGQNGDIGAKGAKGFRGGEGPSGVLGVQGSLGSPGLLGDFGRKGGIGPPGEDGEPGVTKLNWKQCVFTPDMNTARGEIVVGLFKMHCIRIGSITPGDVAKRNHTLLEVLLWELKSYETLNEMLKTYFDVFGFFFFSSKPLQHIAVDMILSF